MPVLDEDGEITEDDVDQVMDVARAVDLAPDQEILHTICQNFYIDNAQRVLRPEGMVGSQLSLDMLIIYGFRNRLNNTIQAINSIPLDVMDVAFGGLCSALAVLTAEQKRSGALVIDLGGGTTDFLAYADNVVATAGALGIGGDHVTNDIAQAFNIPISQAERIKKEAGSVSPETARSTDWVNLPPEGGFPGCKVKLKSLYDVIHARMEETLGMVRKQLEKAGIRHQIGAGIILTGGGAHMDGICGLAEKTFGIPCRVGRPRHVSGLAVPTERPEYAACSGLVQYAFKSAQNQASNTLLSRLKYKLFNK
jgi:cell division protein FtsA